ncbi:LysM peptidoglycan-binding and 3D domain-containing protein [Priestia abyssalis]|uniref:LysM peptidoglycan-binding and 3D domain-containing protein n=1 Tax=Priestia abyssalis TaxID=1221450 RepID=UPI000994BD82|nr:3D domain-containing protein [Priestia abyssalis]
MKKLALTLGAATMLSAGFSGQAFAADTHQVQKGDTLWGIASQHKVTVDAIKDWNDLSSDMIYPKQILNVSPEETVYTVQKGDTLFKIAGAHGISVQDLMRWNGLSSDLIHPNDALTIKSPGTKAVTSERKVESVTNVPEPAPTPQPTAQQSSPQPAEQASGKEITMTATAYTANCEGCSGITATGINLKENPDTKVISVDPSVIPLGSKVFVEGYGEAIAGDTGSAIQGNKIDIFFSSHEQAVQWGVKTVNVKVIK